MADGVCYFLKLPIELRELVYEELLAVHEVNIYSHDGGPMTGKTEEEIATSYFTAELPARKQPLHPQILRTCQQIHAEAEPMLYNIKIIRFAPFHPDAGRLFDIRALCKLRNISTFTIFANNYRPPGLEQSAEHSKFFMGLLGKGLRIAHLRIHLSSRLRYSKKHKACPPRFIELAEQWWTFAPKAHALTVFVRIVDRRTNAWAWEGLKYGGWKKVGGYRGEKKPKGIISQWGYDTAEAWWSEIHDAWLAVVANGQKKPMEAIAEDAEQD